MRLLFLLFSFQLYMYHTSSEFTRDRFDACFNIIGNKGKRRGNVEDIRYVFVKESVRKILKNPIFGYGTGSFGTIFNNEVDSDHLFYTHTTPHNQLFICLV